MESQAFKSSPSPVHPYLASGRIDPLTQASQVWLWLSYTGAGVRRAEADPAHRPRELPPDGSSRVHPAQARQAQQLDPEFHSWGWGCRP